MIFGVDYYPEHWPQERWAEDALWMVAGGITMVRIAEFAWARMEPAEGCFDWDWLDRAVATLSEAGLQVILGTPTAAPPAWLSHTDPDTLPVGEDGQARQFGSRRHYCPNSPTYRRHTRRIVAALAERYGQNVHVIGWQIDNEFGGGKTARCYCPSCAAAFRSWLQARYGDLDSLNRAWGTVFWSQHYNDWSQICPPDRIVTTPNPSQVLDYYRFSSDSYVDYQQMQIDLIRQQAGERQFVTHNFMGLFPDLDHYRLARGLDFVSWDSYPTGNSDRWRSWLYSPGVDTLLNDATYAYDVGDPLITGMAHDLMRGLKHKPFWVMEQQCGQINWGEFNPGIRPGTVRLWAWHALAAGASALVYFRWRAGLYAQEQYHSGLLHHDATPDLGYRELQRMKADLPLMEKVEREPIAPTVALLLDYDDLWAQQIQPHRKNLGYLRHLFAFYRPLARMGIPVDIISPDADLSSYRLVIAPCSHLVDAARAEHYRRFVERGGTLLLGIRSGFKTPSNQVTDAPLPGALRSLVGATVTDWQALPPRVTHELKISLYGLIGAAGYWVEALTPLPDANVQVIASYHSGPFAGQAAFTQHSVGNGNVYYLGWYPADQQVQVLLTELVNNLKIPHYINLPRGMLVLPRGRYTLLLNFTDNSLTASLDGQTITVGPRDVVVHS